MADRAGRLSFVAVVAVLPRKCFAEKLLHPPPRIVPDVGARELGSRARHIRDVQVRDASAIEEERDARRVRRPMRIGG